MYSSLLNCLKSGFVSVDFHISVNEKIQATLSAETFFILTISYSAAFVLYNMTALGYTLDCFLFKSMVQNVNTILVVLSNFFCGRLVFDLTHFDDVIRIHHRMTGRLGIPFLE